MTAHVVVGLHLGRLVAQNNHAFTATECEREVVARFWDAALMVRDQPEVVAHVLLVLRLAPFIDVVLRRNGVAFVPGRSAGRRRVLLSRPTLRLLGTCFLSVRNLRNRRLRNESAGNGSSGSRYDGSLCKIASAHLLTHSVLLVVRSDVPGSAETRS